MRESVGFGMLMYALIPLLIAMIVFIASVMQYVDAYRAVNRCIATIEASDNCATSCSDVDVITPKNDGHRCYVYVKKEVNVEFPFTGKMSLFSVEAETKPIIVRQ